jgi:alanine racemase
MELKSVIPQINCLCERDVVGYGKTYKAKNKCRIATIPIGYADGYFRQLSGIDSVLVNGNRLLL